jgi:CobQ/CobB/MinD/ParA nucleotide binding domain.
LDPQCDATTGLAAVNEFPESCADVLASPKISTVNRAIVEARWQAGHESKIHVMVGSTRSLMVDNPQPTLGELWRLEQALSLVEDEYDLVVIDTPPSLNALTRTAWVASDRVVLVSEPSFFSVVAADRAKKAIDEISTKLSPRLALHGVVVNRLRDNSDEHNFRLGELREMFGEKLIHPHFAERTTLQQSTGAATPIHAWPSEAGADISRAFDSILSGVTADMNATPQARRTRASSPIERAIRGTAKDTLGEFTESIEIVQEKSGIQIQEKAKGTES